MGEARILRIGVCDDVQDDRKVLSRFLAGYLGKAGYDFQITEYAGGEALAADFEDGDTGFDLLFLDIFMGGMDGIDTARKIRLHDSSVPVVFLTTTPDFALEGYDVRALAYLVKPLNAAKAGALLEYFLRAEYGGRQKSILVREGARGARISYREILYAESKDTLVLIHTCQGATHRLYRKLDEVEAELGGRGFLRCHKSYLVNLARVTAAEKTDFVLENGAYVPIRQRDAKKLRDAYFQYLLDLAALSKL